MHLWDGMVYLHERFEPEPSLKTQIFRLNIKNATTSKMLLHKVTLSFFCGYPDQADKG